MKKKFPNATSRRNFMKTSALLAGAATVGFGGMFGLALADADDDKTTILNIAATAEAFAVTYYFQALKSKIFTTTQLAYLKAGLDQEYQHLQFLKANGGTPQKDAFFFPLNTFKDTKTFGAVTATAETVFVGAYLAATRRFAELGQPLLAATVAQVAVVEAEHLALARQIGGSLPNDISLGEPLFLNVSDALPVLQPLLDGKESAFLGKMDTTPISYPGDDEVQKAAAKSSTRSIEPFTTHKFDTSATVAATVAATTAATMAATKPSK